MIARKKLIEVALPLEAINVASAREKSIRHGHPSTLHLWWARRPLAAARAVIFAQMVDDPSGYVDVLRADPKLVRKAETILKARMKLWDEARTLAAKARGTGLSVPEPGPVPTLDEVLADGERQRLFRVLEDLVLWESTTNERVLQAAREEIRQSWRRTCVDNADHSRAKELFDRMKLPAFHDPFAGGGALPLEAQRLGLEAYPSDLNPVAVLINKAMIEIPPKFCGRPPVNPDAQRQRAQMDAKWEGAQGLAEDVRYYGKWMRDEAEKRIGHLYPKVEVTADMAKMRPDLKPYVGKSLTVIAWLWARTVKSPNPAFAAVDVPLASTFVLCSKAGKETYVEPVIGSDGYQFAVRTGTARSLGAAKNGTKLSRGANFRCLMSGVPISPAYIKAEGMAHRLGARLMAVVAEGSNGRVYLPPSSKQEASALDVVPNWAPEAPLPDEPMSCWAKAYGLETFGDLFSSRQLVALSTLTDLVPEAMKKIKAEARDAGLADDSLSLDSGGVGSEAYAQALAIYLAIAVDKASDYWSTACSWHSSKELIRNTFGRQVIPMVWDYAETNPFSDSAGNVTSGFDWSYKVLAHIPAKPRGVATQADAQTQKLSQDRVISTDPPYYNNIGYADLSDFFYVWLRQSLRQILPKLFATVAVPKAEELVASSSRHGGKENAETFFLDGMTEAMRRLVEQAHPAFPVTIYYAFKQSETETTEGTSSTGWETFLGAVIRAGFSISGTWPMRTELGNRMIGSGTNALASSIVLVCRKHEETAPTATRREFVTALKAELPPALAHLQRGNIAPVDLAQAAIGPGMAIYTRYSSVLGAEGKTLSVRDALALINQTLDEALAEQEGDFDADTRWALTWFEQSGFDEGEFGLAEQLSKSKNTSVAGMVDAGIVESKRGKVRLFAPADLPAPWDPTSDLRLTAWEIVHQLIRALSNGGEQAAAELVAKLGAKAEIARELAYRLYTMCERKKRPGEALAYNGLVQSWPEIVRLASEGGKPRAEQPALFGEAEE